MDKRIYLVRHGEIDYGKEKRYIGCTDLLLSGGGIKQVENLREYFSCIKFEKAYTSPLKRCIQTSEIILKGRNIEKIIIPELREISLGEWEKLPLEFVKNNFREHYEKRGKNIDAFVPPGGESFLELKQRVIPAFENIIGNTESNVLIVAHAGVNRVILSTLLNFELNKVLDIYQPYGCVNILVWDEACQKWQYELVC